MKVQGGPTLSRQPEQVDSHLLGYGSLARGPDGWSAGPVQVTSLCIGLGLGLGPGARG